MTKRERHIRHKQGKTVVSAMVDHSVYLQIAQIARQEDVSMSDVIRDAVADLIECRGKCDDTSPDAVAQLEEQGTDKSQDAGSEPASVGQAATICEEKTFADEILDKWDSWE